MSVYNQLDTAPVSEDPAIGWVALARHAVDHGEVYIVGPSTRHADRGNAVRVPPRELGAALAPPRAASPPLRWS